MLFQEIAFWGLAVLTIGSALAVVTLKDLFRAALALVCTFIGVAGLFVLLNAEFLAIVQILIYVGAISVLIIFAIMLTKDVQTGSLGNKIQPLAAILSLLLLASIVYAIFNTDWLYLEEAPINGATLAAIEQIFTNTPAGLANLLLQNFVLPFEAASILLLGAIIGAMVLVRNR